MRLTVYSENTPPTHNPRIFVCAATMHEEAVFILFFIVLRSIFNFLCPYGNFLYLFQLVC